jgi:hypothetical protein
MFRNLLICTVISACVLACASPSPSRPDTKTADAAQPCSLETTASRIPARPGQCSSYPGRSYSQQDLDRTGQTEVGDALQMLDPSITVHH